MAGNTLVVVKGHILSAQGIVWIVAGEAGEATAALAKTGALGKVERLMPGIPRVIPVGGGFAHLGFAMTLAAELIQDGAWHPPRILNRPSCGHQIPSTNRIIVSLFFGHYNQLTPFGRLN